MGYLEKKLLAIKNAIVDKNIYIYKYGVINTDLTSDIVRNTTGANGTIVSSLTKNVNHLLLYSKYTGGVSFGTCPIYTASAINLTNYSKLCFEYEFTELTNCNNALFLRFRTTTAINTTTPDLNTTINPATLTTGVIYKTEIDVSASNVSRYVSVVTDPDNHPNNAQSYMKIYRIWLEL